MIEGSPTLKFLDRTFTGYKSHKNSELFLVNTLEEWDFVWSWLMKQPKLAVDTETSGLRPQNGHRIAGISMGWDRTHFYFPVRHRDSISGGVQPKQLNLDIIRPQLIELFSRKDLTTVWWNLKFDQKMFKYDQIPITCKKVDAAILWHLFDENAPGALKSVASGYKDIFGRWKKGIIGWQANDKEKEISKWRNKEAGARRAKYKQDVKDLAAYLATEIEHQDKKKRELKILAEQQLSNHKYKLAKKKDVGYDLVPISLMTEYAALDTFLTQYIYTFIMKNGSFTDNMLKLFRNEMELSEVLLDCEMNPAFVDVQYLHSVGDAFSTRLLHLEEEIAKELPLRNGTPININSCDQLVSALKESGVVLTETTEKGAYKLDATVLKKLANKHPSIPLILEYRKLSKLKKTYVNGILSKVVDGNQLYFSFNQNVKTGRMSSRDPNCQNIPSRDKTIRKAFICPPGPYTYILADYSQIEVRLAAHLSQDPILLEAYRLGQDIHTRTMCEMFGYDYATHSVIIAEDDKNHPLFSELESLRSIAKTINFAVIYSVSEVSLSEQIGKRPKRYENYSTQAWIDVCGSFIDSYFEKYRGVKAFIDRQKYLVRKHGMVETQVGRIRHLPHAFADRVIDDKIFAKRLIGRAKRQGVNFLVQGLAADVFKIAAVRVARLLKGTKSRLVNFVHDEVQFYFHDDDLHLLPQVKALMEDFTFSVPLIAEFSSSKTHWADKAKLVVGQNVR